MRSAHRRHGADDVERRRQADRVYAAGHGARRAMGATGRYRGPMGAAAPSARRRTIRAAATFHGGAEVELPQGRSSPGRGLGTDGCVLKARASGPGLEGELVSADDDASAFLSDSRTGYHSTARSSL